MEEQPITVPLRTRVSVCARFRWRQTAPMDSLPESLLGRRFYEPKDIGLEREIKERLERMRAAREKK